MNREIRIIRRADRGMDHETMPTMETSASVYENDRVKLDPTTIIKGWIREFRQAKSDEMLAARALMSLPFSVISNRK